MGTPKIHTNQYGFGIISGILVILLIFGIYFAAKFVSRANQDNKEQAAKLQSSLNDSGQGEEGAEAVEDDAPTAPRTYDYPIKSVDVHADPITVTLTGFISKNVTGTCNVDVKRPDGSGKVHYVSEIKHDNECVIFIPTEKLKASSNTWTHHMWFTSDDGLSKGEYPETSFTL